MIDVDDGIVRLTKVRPLGAGRLRVRFKGEKRDREIDLSGLLARSEHFASLRASDDAFAKLAIVERGLGVAWPVQTKWGRLDLSAATLHRIADEQQPMTGADFAAWRATLGLSLTETAKLLGLSRRTVMGYLKMERVPAVVAIACRALARDRNLVAAHYMPGRKTARRAA